MTLRALALVCLALVITAMFALEFAPGAAVGAIPLADRDLPAPASTSDPDPCPDFVAPPGVDIADIQSAAGHWNLTSADPGWDARMDLDRDGDIDTLDLALAATAWGSPCIGLPPDPALVALPLDRTATTSLAAATAFLYTGSSPIQTGVLSGTIQPQQAAVLRGRVLTQDGAALSGVTVSLLNRPEFGSTRSRADGFYDLAVNGGGLLTVQYDKEGYLGVQRQVDAPWLDFAWLPEVVLTALDPNVTLVDLTSPQPMQAARGSVISDTRGARQETLLFPAGLQAVMTLPGGVTQTLTLLHVRATEYTVGANGPQAMPAELPPNSAYTYAAEFSIDEATAAGASGVVFSGPVLSYNENFANLPIGTTVPMGYYDRGQGLWIASAGGRVLRILSVNSGMADLDVDGSGQPATPAALAALGITDAERAALAGLYPVNQGLWRVPVQHFSPWDKNMGTSCEEPCDPPNQPPPERLRVQQPECRPGSIIECQNQVLAERVDLAGAPFFLRYQSDRVPGFQAGYSLRIPLSGASLSPTLRTIHLEIEVAGQKHVQAWQPPSPNLSYTFTWDGRDAYGRLLQGQHPVTVRVGYGFRLAYAATERFGYNGNGVPITVTDMELVFWQVWHGVIGAWDALPQGLGGWSLSAHHAYDPAGRVFYGGDGQRRSVQGRDLIITTAAGPANLAWPTGVSAGPDGSLYVSDGSNSSRIWRVLPDGSVTAFAGAGGRGYSGDGGPALLARFNEPQGLALAADGSLYVADTFNHCIRKIDPAGIITTVAGNGAPGFSGDGGPASAARLSQPYAVAIGPDGSVYIADRNNYRVRRIGTDGLMTTVAGIGFIGYGNQHHGNGGPASLAGLEDPKAVAVGPDGKLFIGNSIVVRMVETNGIISTVAGIGGNCGGGCYSGDGGPATAAQLNSVDGLAVGPDGSLYIAEGNQVVRQVDPTGIIVTIAGSGGVYGFSGDGGPATQARLHLPVGAAIGPDGSLFIADQNNHRIRRVAPALPGLALSDFVIPATEGNQGNQGIDFDEVYVFDSRGRHLRTRHGLTGATLLTFAYDSAGRLATITDGDGNVSTIERSASGQPTAIVGPYGQATQLAVNGQGYLAGVTNPAGETMTFGYTTGGLLTSLGDGRGNAWNFTYDSAGRLVQDADPAGGSITLARLDAAGIYTVALTTALTRTTSYRVEDLSIGTERRTRIEPDGAAAWQEFKTNGGWRAAAADGTLSTGLLGPDPRWGMNAALEKSLFVASPLGVTRIVNRERTATLANGDPLNLVQAIDTVSINGRNFSRTYIGATRTMTGQTPQGRQTIAVLDAQGRIVQEQPGGLLPTSYSYDSHGRLAMATAGSGPQARQTIFSYDSAGRLAATTDPLSQTLGFGYDAAGRVMTETLADGRQALLAYDANGNLVSLTPPGRPAHSLSYTPLNLLASYTPPAAALSAPVSATVIYEYNADRQLTRIGRPDGHQVLLTYDSAGRLSSVGLAAGASSYAYHPTTGQVTTLSAPGGLTLTYAYDGDMLTTETWSGALAGAVSRSYDNDFRLAQISVNGGSPLAYQYDNDGLLTQAGALTLTRHPQHGLISAAALGGVTEAWTYNGFGEPVSYTAAYSGTPLLAVQTVYDKLGRISERAETLGGVTSIYSFTYGLAGELTLVGQNGAVTAAYAYDSHANRISVSGPGGVITGAYDLQDRLLQFGGGVYTMTVSGELASRSAGGQTTTYDYDELGNLTAVTLPDGAQVTYLVDGRQRRVGKKINGVLVQGLLYQDQLQPVAELDGAGQVVSRFIYASRANAPDYLVKGGQTYRIIADHLGSPRLVVNVASGVVAQRLDYDALGRVTLDTNPGFQPFGFAGGLYDPQTGLVRFGARDYDAETGRWTTRDPILFAGGQTNLYVYVENDPVNRNDPAGLDDLGNSTFDRRQMCKNQCSIHASRGRRGAWGCENEPTFYRGDAQAELKCIQECESMVRMIPKPPGGKPGWINILRNLLRQVKRLLE